MWKINDRKSHTQLWDLTHFTNETQALIYKVYVLLRKPAFSSYLKKRISRVEIRNGWAGSHLKVIETCKVHKSMSNHTN